MYEKLPALIGRIRLKGYTVNPGISFCAIGDANCDRAPTSRSVEADNRLDEALGRIWIEEGGGGTGQERLRVGHVLLFPHQHGQTESRQGQEGVLFLRRR